MSGNIAFNPFVMTNAGGTFGTSWAGLMQGTAMNDPAVRYALAGGYLDPAETLPMWGGVGISEMIPGGASENLSLQGAIKRAASLSGATALTGFTVFDQAHAMINTPQSPVPLASPGMSVNFYRLGSGARIAVACDPALVDLDGNIITSQVSWDFVDQMLVPYNAAYNENVITGASWASTGGGRITFTTTSAHGLGVGVDIDITGMTPDGYNGHYTTLAGTTGSTIVVANSVDPGSATVFGVLEAGGGALNVRVLSVEVGTSMVVSYDPTTGFATWNRSGSAAVILI